MKKFLLTVTVLTLAIFFAGCGGGGGSSTQCEGANSGSSNKSESGSVNTKGVVINGVKWATCNVGASIPEEFGNYYTWEEAQNVCPKGWRLPTAKELESLVNAGSKWTNVNGVKGRMFGSGNTTIFMPATGYLHDGGKLFYDGANGYALGNGTTDGKTTAYYLHFDDDDEEVEVDDTSNQSLHKMSVRCVAK